VATLSLALRSHFTDGAKMERIEIDCSTGEVKQIKLSAAEVKSLETIWAENSAALSQELAAADKTSATQKLLNLGLTIDDLKALGL
jgi:hypothetical protein